MLKQLKTRLDDAERRLRGAFGNDISTPSGRRAAFWHFHLMDHAFLRAFWSNMGQVAPGVWRSNQPSARRLRRYARMGIRSIISLRGDGMPSYHLFEAEACKKLGIDLHFASIRARAPTRREKLLHLLDLFETVEKPFLVHCKSGADRAGLASALYLMHVEGRPVEEARKELSLRYLHLKNDSTGILDYFLDAYAADNAETPMPIRRWIETRYDRKALKTAFRKGERPGKIDG